MASRACSHSVMRWLQLRIDFDSTAVRRLFDYLVINVTVTQPASRSHADLFIHLGCSEAARAHR